MPAEGPKALEFHTIGVAEQSQTHLAQIAHAFGLAGTAIGPAQCWQEHSGQNGDDGDDDQEFDQSKAPDSTLG